MKIPAWTPEAKPQPPELVDAIAQRRGGALLNLDRVLLWSEPIARGWNVYMKHLRQDLSTSPKLRELAICTVATVQIASSRSLGEVDKSWRKCFMYTFQPRAMGSLHSNTRSRLSKAPPRRWAMASTSSGG